jgi:hypothetical protein
MVKVRNRPTQASGENQGCQMVCFQTKNQNLGKFWRVSQWKMLVYFMDTWSILRSFVICILWTFGIACGICYIFPRFGILYLEKSGNPGENSHNLVTDLQVYSALAFRLPFWADRGGSTC